MDTSKQKFISYLLFAGEQCGLENKSKYNERK